MISLIQSYISLVWYTITVYCSTVSPYTAPCVNRGVVHCVCWRWASTYVHLPGGHEVGALPNPLKDLLQLGVDEGVVWGGIPKQCDPHRLSSGHTFHTDMCDMCNISHRQGRQVAQEVERVGW